MQGKSGRKDKDCRAAKGEMAAHFVPRGEIGVILTKWQEKPGTVDRNEVPDCRMGAFIVVGVCRAMQGALHHVRSEKV